MNKKKKRGGGKSDSISVPELLRLLQQVVPSITAEWDRTKMSESDFSPTVLNDIKEKLRLSVALLRVIAELQKCFGLYKSHFNVEAQRATQALKKAKDKGNNPGVDPDVADNLNQLTNKVNNIEKDLQFIKDAILAKNDSVNNEN